MLQILVVIFPCFALVLCGCGAARYGLLPLAAIRGLNGFLVFFALPCMLYRFGASTPIAQLLDPAVALGKRPAMRLNRRPNTPTSAKSGAIVCDCSHQHMK